MNRRPCFICGQDCQPVLDALFDDRFGAPGNYDIVRCSQCGFEQTWPRPSEAELQGLYERYYNFGGEQNTAYTNIRQRFLDSPLYRFWLKWDGDISFHLRRGTGRLLDIGCNEGRGLAIYARNGFQAEGLEVNERAAAMAREQGFTVHTVPLAQFMPERLYDFVVLSNVLEHVPDPVAMLSQIRRLLSPEGQVWISCPNAASYWRQVFGRHWINWHVPFHLWHFSPQILESLLARAGFQVVNLKTCTPALWISQSICAKLGSRAGRANRWMRSAPVIANLMIASRFFGSPFLKHIDQQTKGDCLLVTASVQI